MKVRISGFPYWTCFWFSIPLHFLFLSGPIVYLVAVLFGNTKLETAEPFLMGGIIYIGICICVFSATYLIWRHKYPDKIVFNKKKGIIWLHKDSLFFEIKDCLVEPDYQDFYELFTLL